MANLQVKAFVMKSKKKKKKLWAVSFRNHVHHYWCIFWSMDQKTLLSTFGFWNHCIPSRYSLTDTLMIHFKDLQNTKIIIILQNLGLYLAWKLFHICEKSGICFKLRAFVCIMGPNVHHSSSCLVWSYLYTTREFWRQTKTMQALYNSWQQY